MWISIEKVIGEALVRQDVQFEVENVVVFEEVVVIIGLGVVQQGDVGAVDVGEALQEE